MELGKIVGVFQDGVSLAAYLKIGRLIRKFGPKFKVEFVPSGDTDIDHPALQKALDAYA